jgi:DNA repair exonuclease SbcCD ATPase subunit
MLRMRDWTRAAKSAEGVLIIHRDWYTQLEDTRQQLEELRRSLAESRERVWKLEGAELRCQELAEKVATLKQERDEMLQQQAALLERMDANNAADSGHAKRPTHMLTLPPPPNPNRPVTDGGEWALREALAESEAERDELVHQLARARERFDLVNGIVGRSEQQVCVCVCDVGMRQLPFTLGAYFLS